MDTRANDGLFTFLLFQENNEILEIRAVVSHEIKFGRTHLASCLSLFHLHKAFPLTFACILRILYEKEIEIVNLLARDP
jgi:hypothetical protein